MVRVEEANMPSAMKFVFEEIIEPLLTQNNMEGKVDYRPKNSSKDDSWNRDNPTTGVLYLSDYPSCKQAWVLVKFEQRTDKKFGQHAKYDHNTKISNKEQFKEFFGTEPSSDFEWPEDMVIYARWDKRLETNKYAYRDFDETTPNFYMYTNHLKSNLDVVIKRLKRIQEILETNPKAIQGNQFVIPYSATNTKM